jgi:ParB family chromosome partitioning protein
VSLDLSGLDAPAAPADTAARAPLRRFEEDPENPRTEFDGPEFEAFVDDIRQRGILQPLVVIKTAAGKLRIRFGARRFRAAVRLKLDYIPYVVVDDVRQLDGYAQVSENEKRKGLEPLELASFIARRVTLGESKASIAQKLGITASMVSILLALLDAPAFVGELYASGRCRNAEYLYRLRRLLAKSEVLVLERVAEVGSITSTFLDRLAAEVEASSRPDALLGRVAPRVDSGPEGEGRSVVCAGAIPSKPAAPAPQDRSSRGREGERDVTKSVPVRDLKIQGKHAGRDVVLVLSRLPSLDGRVFVRYEDGGGEAEVACGDVVLMSLTGSAA